MVVIMGKKRRSEPDMRRLMVVTRNKKKEMVDRML